MSETNAAAQAPDQHPLLSEAIQRGAIAVRHTSAVMLSEHEAHRLSAAVLGAAEPALRRHLLLELADDVERTVRQPTNGRALAEAIRLVVRGE